MDEIEGMVRELVDRGGCDPIIAGAVVAKIVRFAATRPSTGAERTARWRANKRDESDESDENVTNVTPPSLSIEDKDSKKEKEERKRERGVRLPDHWSPSPADLAFTAEKGMPEAVIAREVEKFRLHWHGKHGPTAVKTLDRGWPAAWRTWVIRACEWAGWAPSTGPPKPKLPEADVIRLRERYEQKQREKW